ncbi:MAG: glyoxalase [Pseudozobellia sp.]|nr:glyoxalase [Pseudozobellia sp.]MBG48518.1 glyoxalase [Pseudozobellia sp.]|tara:strand:+ start:85 stop:468 length:384 start_codon:yes stop_codon:yes gene_type:complete
MEIFQVSYLVKDYDEAIEFFTKKLDFSVLEDTQLTDKKRWVLVAPKSNKRMRLLLAKADNALQESTIGNQAGGRVFLFLNTDDFWTDYQIMKDNGVTFKEEPREEPYGTVVVFSDLYGNLWDLIQPN